MKKFFAVASIALFTFALLIVQESQARGKGSRMGKGHHKPVSYQDILRHADEINLDENQMAQIEKIGIAAEKEMIQLKAERDILALDLRKEMEADDTDRKTVISLIEKTNDIDGQMKKNRLLLLLDMKNILTDEQIDKIEELRKSYRDDRMERRMQHRQGMGFRSDRPFSDDRSE